MPKADKAPLKPASVKKAAAEFAKAEKELAETQKGAGAGEEEKLTEAGEEQALPSETQEEEPIKTPSRETGPERDYGDLYNELATKKGIKSPEDLAEMYVNLERRASRVENMARDTLRRVDESRQAEVSTEEEEARAEALSLLRQTVQEVVRQELTPLRADQDRKLVDDEISKVQAKYPWFKGQLINDAVAMMARGEARSLEDAAKVLTYDIATAEAHKVAEKEGKVIEKRSAFAESAGSASGSKEIDYESMTLEELEEVLPKAGDFIDSKGRLRKV